MCGARAVADELASDGVDAKRHEVFGPHQLDAKGRSILVMRQPRKRRNISLAVLAAGVTYFVVTVFATTVDPRDGAVFGSLVVACFVTLCGCDVVIGALRSASPTKSQRDAVFSAAIPARVP